MAELRQNTWTTDAWYDQYVAGTTGGYNAYTTGTLWAWGHNENGALGQNQDSGGPGSSNSRSSPIQIGTSSDWSDINSGGMEFEGCFASKSDGTLWSWGRNASGVLGHNTGEPSPLSSPTQIPGTWAQRTDEDVYIDRNCKFSAKENALAIKPDGTLWTWGGSGFGGLGLNQGPGNSRSSPCQVGTDTTWISTMTGRDMGVFGMKSDGTLWCWGRNPGRLGLNDQVHRSSPTQIPGTTWRSFRMGTGQHPIATKTDGTLWAWGSNGGGQLGDNTTISRSSPIQVGTDTDWRMVTTMADSSAAIKTDGSLWTWGRNEEGILGHKDFAQNQMTSSPTQVGTDTTWYNITSIASYSMMGTKTDGSLWAWGSNYEGVLGRNQATPARRSSPTQIPGTNWIGTRMGQQSLGAYILRS